MYALTAVVDSQADAEAECGCCYSCFYVPFIYISLKINFFPHFFRLYYML